jgi:transcription elongation factor Elf1
VLVVQKLSKKAQQLTVASPSSPTERARECPICMELMERMLRLACAQNRGKVVCGNCTERPTNCELRHMRLAGAIAASSASWVTADERASEGGERQREQGRGGTRGE